MKDNLLVIDDSEVVEKDKQYQKEWELFIKRLFEKLEIEIDF